MDREEPPALFSRSEAATPPLISEAKRVQANGTMRRGHEREGSEAVDAEVLSKALREVKDGVQSRERTPTSSPSRKRQRIYGDRLVLRGWS